MPRTLIRGARLPGRDAPDSLVIADGRIMEISPDSPDVDDVLDLGGRWLVPGLWDRHVHFTQWARTRGRLDVSGAANAGDVCDAVGAVGGDALLIGFGFRWATWDTPPTLDMLDAARPAPTVVISGDLHTSWVNSAAAVALGLPAAGVLREDAAFAAQRVLDSAALTDSELDGAIGAAHARGIVGVVDFEMADNAAVWALRVADGSRPLRVEAGFYGELLDARVAAGVRSGDTVPGTAGMVTHGALKIITDGSLNTLTAHCVDPYPGGGHGAQNAPADQLERMLARARAAGITVAVHAIGDHANAIALDAFAATGARGSIEHAQLVAHADLPRFAELGVVASVQPEHAVDDRDAADTLWAGRTDRAFPLRSLLDQGVTLALGSDAPVAPLDPWIAIAAAVSRTRDGRPAWHGEQAINAAEALDASVRHRIVPGAAADLVATDADPLAATGDALRSMPVALTMIAGAVVHDSR